MRISRLLIAVALIGSTLAFGLPQASADFTVNSWGLGTNANDLAVPGANFVTDATVINPFSQTTTATEGGSSSTTNYDFAWDAAGGSFNWTFEHQRAGVSGSFGESGQPFAGSPFTFSVTGVNMLYDFSGAYSLAGAPAIFASVRLFDITANSDVFRWIQLSRTTSDESFTVGEHGGDDVDILIGTPSGTLLAEHEYNLTYGFGIQNLSGADDSGGVTGMGNLHMDITPIPAPGAVVLAMLGLPLVGWVKRRFA